MTAILPNCDVCGRFTANGVEIETSRPDFWNGPNVTLYCPRCLAARELADLSRNCEACIVNSPRRCSTGHEPTEQEQS